MSKRLKIYLSGPMTNVPNHNYPMFNKQTKLLRKAGYKVINPAELDSKTPGAMTWNTCLRRDIRYIVQCEAVATLPGCKDSRGATLEIYIAKKLNMPVFPVAYYLTNNKRVSK